MAKRGPKTNAGRTAVRQNAISHGISSESPVIGGVESHDEWEAHRQGTLTSLSPQGHLETELAERIALLLWRLRRVARYERHSIEVAQEQIVDDHEHQPGRYFDRLPDTPAEAEGKLASANELVELLEGVPKLSADKQIDAQKAVAILDAAAASVGWEYEIDRKKLPVQGTWSAEQLHASLRNLADEAEADATDLLEHATDQAKQEVERSRSQADELSRKLEQMSRERLLPEDDVINKVTRYEAHLHRQLIQTMHELEAMQARRGGMETPLARLDLSGDNSPASDGAGKGMRS